jgi:hypothetical protein
METKGLNDLKPIEDQYRFAAWHGRILLHKQDLESEIIQDLELANVFRNQDYYQ